MTSRRLARRRDGNGATRTGGSVPGEFLDQLDPLWRDADALAARFPDLVTATDLERVRAGRRLYHHLLNRWAAAHGFLTATGTADFHALRRAGVIR